MKKNFLSKLTMPRGFTLIEVMVVIVILGILAGIIAPKLIGRTYDGQLAKAKLDIVSMETALKLYKLDNGMYPTTEQGLQALVEQPTTGTTPKKWREGGYLEKYPLDPWKNEYVYLCPGMHGDFDIISYGRDGTADGEGEDTDINNWEIE